MKDKSSKKESPSFMFSLFRELVAITLSSLLSETLPMATEKILSCPPTHPLAVSILSLWLVYHATGVVPHAATRICERRLDRSTTLPVVFTLVLYCAQREAFAYYFRGNKLPDMSLPTQQELAKLVFPFLKEVLQTIVLAMSLLVIPVLLKLNGMFPKLWMLLPLLAIPGENETKNPQASWKSSVAAFLTIQLVAGWMAGRWMNRFFPDDPTVEKLMRS